MTSLLDKVGPKMVGHVLIRDKVSKDVIQETFNAINNETMSYALALSLADRTNGNIFQMAFGNGGSTVSAVGTITYLPPNVTGLTAALYNQTYAKIVDDNSPLNTDASDNYMTVQHTTGQPYSDIQVTCTLEYDEPSGQAAYDNATLANNTNPSGSGSAVATYIFDELGLVSYNSTGTGMLLSHVIFHPIQKALNVSIEVIYTIRIYMG